MRVKSSVCADPIEWQGDFDWFYCAILTFSITLEVELEFICSMPEGWYVDAKR
jgi:hypothetical protein